MFIKPTRVSVVLSLFSVRFVRFPGTGVKLVWGTEEIMGTLPVSPIKLVPKIRLLVDDWLG